MKKKLQTCCFIGHRVISETEELKMRLCKMIEKLIVDENVDTFLFGSKSRFDSLCHELVTAMKEKYHGHKLTNSTDHFTPKSIGGFSISS